ncbi:MAG: hypothetical protein AABX00_00620 [Nanoarchaeota archaeon]
MEGRLDSEDIAKEISLQALANIRGQNQEISEDYQAGVMEGVYAVILSRRTRPRVLLQNQSPDFLNGIVDGSVFAINYLETNKNVHIS